MSVPPELRAGAVTELRAGAVTELRAGAVTELRDGAVHVWRADLDRVDPDEVLSLLIASERRRALGIVDPLRRARWASSRGLLRLLLGEYAGVEPRALQIARRETGKLVLLEPAPPRFNVAHSGPVAVYAFGRSWDVGVDVEVPRARGARARAARQLDVAKRAFGAAEASRLAALARHDRAVEFCRLWVRREAALKCSGAGVFPSRAAVRARACEPWIGELDLGQDLIAAVAVECEPRELLCFDLRDRASGGTLTSAASRSRMRAGVAGHEPGAARAASLRALAR